MPNSILKTAAQDDPRMGQFYQHLITVWTKESGGGVFGNFALATRYGPYGVWGVLIWRRVRGLSVVQRP